MPIADGYEAIKNINNLFDDNKLLNISLTVSKTCPLIGDADLTIKKPEDKPIIIACSGYVDDGVINAT